MPIPKKLRLYELRNRVVSVTPTGEIKTDFNVSRTASRLYRHSFRLSNNSDLHVAEKVIDFDTPSGTIQQFRKYVRKLGLRDTPNTLVDIHNHVIKVIKRSGIPLGTLYAKTENGQIRIYSKYVGTDKKPGITKKFEFEELSNKELEQLMDYWAKLINSELIPTNDFAERRLDVEEMYPMDIDQQVLYWMICRAEPNRYLELLDANSYPIIASLSGIRPEAINYLLERIKNPEIKNFILTKLRKRYSRFKKPDALNI